MRKEIRFGMVGYGGRGAGMFKLAAESFEGIMPVAICDNNPSNLENARKKFPQAQLYAQFDEMLEKAGLDALLIATPALRHAEFSIKALDHQIHVLSEIPTVASVEEAQGLWKAHLRSKALYMTGANPNYWAFIETAVDLKKKGLLGKPYYIEAEYIHDIRELFKCTPWRATLEPIIYCTHSLGPMLRLIEEDFEWTSCFDTGSHVTQAPDRHDAMVALFHTRSNVVLRLLTSFINNYPTPHHHYRIFTTKGTFERTPDYGKDCPPRTLFYSTELYGDRDWVKLPSEYIRLEHAGNAKATGHGGADYAMVEAFFKAIREGGPSPISLREGLRMTLPGIYAAASARRGGELTRINYPWNRE